MLAVDEQVRLRDAVRAEHRVAVVDPWAASCVRAERCERREERGEIGEEMPEERRGEERRGGENKVREEEKTPGQQAV